MRKLIKKMMNKLIQKMLNKKMRLRNSNNKWKKIIFKNKMKMMNNKRMIDIYFHINLYCVIITIKRKKNLGILIFLLLRN